MSTIVSKPGVTPDELLKMPDADRYELADGHLVEREMGSRSSHIGVLLSALLISFCKEHRLGWVFGSDCGYQCYPDDPTRVRKPDVSFIRMGRLPNEQAPDGHILIAPDVAVEVVSPHDLVYEIETKVQEYLGAGGPARLGREPRDAHGPGVPGRWDDSATSRTR
jgi:Uma2 family endonuclease